MKPHNGKDGDSTQAIYVRPVFGMNKMNVGARMRKISGH